MNIAMQKDILALRKSVQELEEKFNEKLKNTLHEESSELLGLAEESLIRYLTNEGFELDRKQIDKGQLVARMGEIWVSLNRKPLILSVTMSNGERYTVSLESTLVPLEPMYKYPNRISQEKEISNLQNRIDDIRNKLDQIDEQQFRYSLSTEEYRDNNISYPTKIFLTFHDVMDTMFS